MKLWFLIVGVGTVAFLATARAIVRSRRQKAFAVERLELAMGDIFQRWYEPRGFDRADFVELWVEISECLGENPGLLRPGDRFGKDVGSEWITTDELDELGSRARLRAKSLGREVDLSQLHTVDDYLVTLARVRMKE